MIDFFEINEEKKTVKILNLDDFSIEDLKVYLQELQVEIERVNSELLKKRNFKDKAENYFK